ncbi:MAG: phosphoadenosine phosphosulfate reductase family protein [Candidatus Micrarchaeaceae archaeon]
MSSLGRTGKGIGLSEMAEALAERLPLLSVRDRILMPMGLFGERAIVTTSFGPTSAVLLDMASRACPGITVLNIRHGHETPGTLLFAEQCQELFPINLVVADAPRLPIPETGSREFEEFRQATKVVPLRKALLELGAWFWLTGVMHDETDARRDMEMARARHGAVAIYPILDWTSREAMQYCLTNDLPINGSYHDPCKGPGQSLECGLHYGAAESKS